MLIELLGLWNVGALLAIVVVSLLWIADGVIRYREQAATRAIREAALIAQAKSEVRK